MSSGTASATRPARVYAAPKAAAILGNIGREVRFLTEAHGPFEQGERPGQVALAEGQQTDPPRGKHEARGVTNRLGNPEPFFPEGTALGERAQLGMAPGEAGTGEHGGQENLAEALAAPRPVEGRHGLPEAVDRPTIVALGLVGYAEVVVRQRVQDDIPAGRGEREGALGGGDGLVIRAHEDRNGMTERQRPVPADEGRRGPRRGPRPRAEPPGYAQSRRRKERRAQGEPEIDGLLVRVVLSPADAGGH